MEKLCCNKIQQYYTANVAKRENFKAGVYFVTVHNGGESKVIKLVKD